jgi:glycosyltransferase involved in cell wall biosynthesis
MRCPTLADLPPPPVDKTGWPWTVEAPQLLDARPDGTSWPRISIVTPTYNQGAFIEGTIRSILLQGYPDLEYIIVDGGSTDGAVDIIRKYSPWLTYWVSEPDRGQAHAINKGFQKASGQLLNWLNSDDVLLRNALRTVADIAELMPQAGIISGCRLQENGNGHVFVAQIDWLRAWPLYVLGFPEFPQESSFFSRQVWDAVEAVDEGLTYFFDVGFFARALAATDCMAVTNAPLSKMSVHPQMKTLRDDPERKAWEMRQVYAKHMPRWLFGRLVARLLRTRYHHLVTGVLCQMLRTQRKVWVVDYSPVSDRWVPYKP